MTEQDVRAEIREQNIAKISLQFTDILGAVKHVEIPCTQIDKALAGELMFDGSSIQGFVRIEESDMYLRPDPDTFAVLPWITGEGIKTARLICDIYNPDGTPFEGDPRYALKRVMAEAADQGYVMNVGSEPEFFLFERRTTELPQPIDTDHAGYFDMAPVDRGEAARSDIVYTLQQMGFEIEASHHEVAPSQHEIDFQYADALRTADLIATFHVVVRTIALRHGLHATFMPKPIYGQNGSGMHLHQSLAHLDGTNAFFDPSTPDQLSDVARHYIAGLMEHAAAITPITNPLVNSYKRLVPGYEAPVYVAWSYRNRSPMIRIPEKRGNSTRIELRSPDPSCNPYLALAVTLKAGLDGIQKNSLPPEPVNQNIYQMSAAERREKRIGSLPGSLGEAIAALEEDEIILDALGPHIARKFIEAKKIEWEVYRSQVTTWELSEYLYKY